MKTIFASKISILWNIFLSGWGVVLLDCAKWRCKKLGIKSLLIILSVHKNENSYLCMNGKIFQQILKSCPNPNCWNMTPYTCKATCQQLKVLPRDTVLLLMNRKTSCRCPSWCLNCVGFTYLLQKCRHNGFVTMIIFARILHRPTTATEVVQFWTKQLKIIITKTYSNLELHSFGQWCSLRWASIGIKLDWIELLLLLLFLGSNLYPLPGEGKVSEPFFFLHNCWLSCWLLVASCAKASCFKKIRQKW